MSEPKHMQMIYVEQQAEFDRLRAINAELLEACKALQSMLRDMDADKDVDVERLRPALIQMQNAIAKAEGKQ